MSPEEYALHLAWEKGDWRECGACRGTRHFYKIHTDSMHACPYELEACPVRARTRNGGSAVTDITNIRLSAVGPTGERHEIVLGDCTLPLLLDGLPIACHALVSAIEREVGIDHDAVARIAQRVQDLRDPSKPFDPADLQKLVSVNPFLRRVMESDRG